MGLSVIKTDKGWMPDYPDSLIPEGGLSECSNLVPLDSKYAPFCSKLVYSTNAVTGTPLQGMEYMSENGIFYPFFGTTTKLYRLEIDKSLTNISKAATTYNALRWSFEKYGNWIVATNFTEVPQVLKGLDSSNFVDLGGNPPKAKYCLLHRGHLMFAYLNESGIVAPQKILWSALENIEDYTPSILTGADYQNLSDADGDITGIARVGNNVAIFHRNSITMCYYTGSPYTFSIQTNAIKNVGAIEGTIVSLGDMVYFWDYRDIYSFDGNTVTPLGEGIKETLLSSYEPGSTNLINTVVDRKNHIIYWSYSTTGTTSICNRILCYNYHRHRYSLLVDCDNTALALIHTGGVDMDSIDSLYPDINNMPYQIDNAAYAGNEFTLVGFGSDGKAYSFSGTQSSVVGGFTMTTGEIKRENDPISLTKIIPTIISPDANCQRTVKVYKRDNELESLAYFGSKELNADTDECCLRVTGKRIQLKVNVSGGNFTGMGDILTDLKIVGRR